MFFLLKIISIQSFFTLFITKDILYVHVCYVYRECYSSYAYALASTGHSTVRLYFALHLLVLLICAEVLNDR